MLTTQSSLLLRLRSTDNAAAWDRFVHLYTPLIRHWVIRLHVESNQADDLVQDIFVVLLKKLSDTGFAKPNSFRAWLRTVTLNKCRDWFRQQKQASKPEYLAEIEAAIDDPNELLTQQEYLAFLSKTALQLMRDAFSDTTWRACWEHVAEGRTASHVAAELGISENAVYLARGRVLKRLRVELDGLWE